MSVYVVTITNHQTYRACVEIDDDGMSRDEVNEALVEKANFTESFWQDKNMIVGDGDHLELVGWHRAQETTE